MQIDWHIHATITGLFRKQVDLAADRKAWENLTDVRLDDLEFATAWNEKSPMHVAIEKGHVECAQFILSRGKGAHQFTSQIARWLY